MATGLRLGEVTALHREDITNAGIVVRRRGYRLPKGVWDEADSKTRAGRRVLRWSPLLRRAVERQRETAASSPLVFPSTTMTPLWKDNIRRALQRDCAAVDSLNHYIIATIRPLGA